MPMGIVSNADFQKELDNSGNREQVSPALVKEISRGRGEGNVEVPNALRNIIGDTAITNGRKDAVELASNFGISPSSVSAYTNGATSTASYGETPNKDVMDGTRLRIQSKARAKLIKAIHGITDDKLAVTNAKDLAGIAKDMAAVVKTMEPENKKVEGEKGGPTFIFYTPQTRKEETFDVVFTKEG